MREINARTEVYALLGHPVGHSVSPMLQNSLAEYSGDDLCYTAFDIKNGDIGTVLRGAHAMGIKGFNVTVPFKQAVMEHISFVDETAKRIGAVNTLKWTEEGYEGYNTDMPGFLRSLESEGVELKGRDTVVLGAGGAAYAICCALLEGGAGSVTIYNRTMARAEALMSHFKAFYPGRDIRCAADKEGLITMMGEAGGHFLAVQTTSLGMYPDTEGKLIEDGPFYALVDEGTDIVFNPSDTAFMKAVRAGKEGNRAFNGLKMLLYQGMRSYEIWRGHCPEGKDEELLEKMRAAIGG
ncbi:MAG: shikimate dehydrogenase [Lachnospiraceae bacterium]|nr:shikimate dehydrogenase [Lachnospiraceae bacterium]